MLFNFYHLVFPTMLLAARTEGSEQNSKTDKFGLWFQQGDDGGGSPLNTEL